MQLRDYQQESIDALYNYFRVEGGNPLVIAPTGSGKSVMIGGFIKDTMTRFENQRIIVLTHVRELIEQNHQKLHAFWPDAPSGVYCAGLRKKDFRQPIVFASIQSVHKKAHLIGFRHLCIIDEAHLLSKDTDTMYRRFLNDLLEYNKKMKVIGYTATGFRTRSGMLHQGDDALFTDVAYEIPLKRLLESRHVSPLISKSSATQADLSHVRITAGEYNAKDMEVAFDDKGLTKAAITEILSLAGNRKAWLIFCSGVAHAEHVNEALKAHGILSDVVTGETKNRDVILGAFKAGQLQAVVNCNVLTTGFDHPGIDLIVLLRATTSPGLYVQMVGRGLRCAPLKENCLVLDYGGNIEEHGPITHVQPPALASERKKKKKEDDDDWKICPKCRSAVERKAEECLDCGHEFKRDATPNHQREASEASIVSMEDLSPTKWMEVSGLLLRKHVKKDKPQSLHVKYICGMKSFPEWVCLEHEGYAKGKATRWWMEAAGTRVPLTVDEALSRQLEIKKPTHILVKQNGKYAEILDRRFEGDVKKMLQLQLLSAPEGHGVVQQVAEAPAAESH